MSVWRRLLSGCFSHEPIKVLVKGKLHLECQSCHEDLGAILPGLKLRTRKEKRPKRKSAEVLTIAGRKRA